MKLENKKELAARTLGVGKGRIVFNKNKLQDLKEAITKQDIRDLHASGAIIIKEVKGRKKIVKRKSRRRAGSFKLKVKNSKRSYITLTRKLRKYIQSLRVKKMISQESYLKLRKEIRAGSFKNLSYLKERISSMEKK